MKDNVKKFLKQLTILSNEYQVYIGGCGCCGSPYVFGEGTEKDTEYVELNYDEEKKIYNIQTVAEIKEKLRKRRKEK